jgi:hypothetical protein
MATVTYTTCDVCNPGMEIGGDDRPTLSGTVTVPYVEGCEDEAVQLHRFRRFRFRTYDKLVCPGCFANHEILLDR